MSTQFIPFWFETKYISPTTSRGARIKATYHGVDYTVSITVPYPHELSGSDCYRVALDKLMEQPRLKELYPQYHVVAHTEFPKDKSSYWWSVQQVYPIKE